jgi:hypothetical protein
VIEKIKTSDLYDLSDFALNPTSIGGNNFFDGFAAMGSNAVFRM